MDSGKVAHRRKTDITAIRARASEERRQDVEQVSVKSLELSKVIHLLEDPLTAMLKERHLFVLKKLLKRNQVGFSFKLLRELTGITKILNICAERVEEHPEYAPILCEALRICRLPFMKEKASDELNHAPDVIEFLSHLGCLMRVSDAGVRQHIVESVKSFYSCVAPKQLLDGLQPTSPAYRLQLLELSELTATLLRSMAAQGMQPSIKLGLLQTLQLLSSSSDVNCASILGAWGAETICLNLNEPDPSAQLLTCSLEILRNLLERGGEAEVTAQLCSLECVTSLKEAFTKQLLSGSGDSHLRLANDLLVIIKLIVQNTSSVLIESLFAKQLVALATFPEMKSCDPLVKNLELNFSHEALTMKKLLLNLLVLMSQDSAALQLYKEQQVLLALLTLATPPPASSAGRSASRRWSSAQQEELRLQALDTLASLAPLLLDDYMKLHSNTRLLTWCVKDGAHITQGDSSKKLPLRLCVRVLRAVMSLGEDLVQQDLCDQDAMNLLLGFLMQMEARPEGDDVLSLEIQSDIQLILSLLCESNMHRKELFGSEGVEMVVHFLRKGSDMFHSGLGHNKLVLTTVDCVWSCIVGCYTTEDYFLAKDGVFLLLDLLSSSPRCVHGHILSTLLELCDNPGTLALILSWSERSGRTAPSLLLQLWREEEEELRVSRDQDGGIADLQRPLLSVLQQEETDQQLQLSSPSAAVLELSENLRSKIYSIFCKLGFQDLPGLSTQHNVTLSIVKRYLDFKVGEVWEEVVRELRLEGVRPISPDEEALSSVCRTLEETARMVSAEQSRLLEQEGRREAHREKLVYTEIMSSRKQQELVAKSWDNYVSKTSNYEILKEVKAQREKMIESSRVKQEDAGVQAPECYVGQVVSLEATGAQGPGGVRVTLAGAPIKPASQEAAAAASQDPEYFSTVSVRD